MPEDSASAPDADAREGRRRRLRLPTPPLWLFGLLEGVQTVLLTALLIAVPTGLITFLADPAAWDVEGAGQAAGQLWLIMHAAPLDLSGEAVGRDGVFHAVPLGLTLIPVLLSWRSGRRLAQGAYPTQLWLGLATFVLVLLAAAAGLAVWVETPFGATSPMWAALAAGGLALLASTGGCVSEARSVARMFGMDMEERIDRWSAPVKWAGAYLWAVLRAGAASAVAAVGLAAALLAGVVLAGWMDIANAYQQADAGWGGAVGLTVLQLALVPNLLLWTLAYTTGAGFSLGADAPVEPGFSAAAGVDYLPVLAVVPDHGFEHGWVVFALPVLAGLYAGVWLAREGENHFDDWCALRIRVRAVSLSISTLVLGALTGLVAAVLLVGPLWLSHLSLGVGRFADVGPDALLTAGLLGAWTAAGCAAGYLTAPLSRTFRRTPAS
ncbi:DUF6350 family protein [Nesterenkonia populi]|uniref:cell division protein PerM n=1 Tax=Nesterenkonia populi TaxID=1591087 RepID=UPI0011BF37D4|nr:DUF6350 family protein [Nesterenkonia populi]